MTDIRAGSLVRWSDQVRDNPATRISRQEVFRVKRVGASERCDLVDATGAELFNVPVGALQLYEFEQIPHHVPYRRKGFPSKNSQSG